MTAAHTASETSERVEPLNSEGGRADSADSGTTSRLSARGVSLAYGERVVVDGLDLDVLDGGITGVIGPNGCGKSTLLRALGRLLQPRSGSVLLDGKRIHRMSTKEVARTLGLLPQTPSAPEGLCVADLVARGRHPHQTWYRQWSSDDESAVAEALELTGIGDLAERPVDELSGGQRQRAWLSMALAQHTDLLLLDEPTTYLDLSHQVDVLELIGRLHAESGRTVVMVLHDLNFAARYADRLVAMVDGRVAAEGAPEEVVTERLLEEVFDLRARVVPDPVVGTPMVVPVGGRGSREAGTEGSVAESADPEE
ncbi:iron complex transport system ATP-binding protein [Actinopolyspora biskrensis]|uniref:Iron complex transport system ATP-binding protein n=1 Tax=Actinopolyspora biskrensis TaxID=1470178 RepID=A0A852YZS5_9ACTN|nr:ABC transporter ATP-binding protein [Actinopolyspora biskrensis]NYH80544.1 iron complex transport system ATP-binding protein [Actinopolyspora biskrensis]